MSVMRHSEGQLRQFASQVHAVSVAELRAIEEFLPIEETPNFLRGLLAGLGVGFQAMDDQRAQFGKVIAVLAERILNSDADLQDLH